MACANVWFEYVRTQANVADEPSRVDLSGDRYEFGGGMVAGVTVLATSIPIASRLPPPAVQRTPTPPFNDDTARGFNSPVPWHAYRLVDLYASWQHSEQLSVDFNIDNATDQYYLDALSLGMVPAPGRTARLSLTWSF